jgi:hypothetical protein
MIPLDLAVRLRDAGLVWAPAPGDRFALADRGIDEVFVLSHMTIEVHELPQGPVIGFNGTVEWALDDVEQDEAIWLPHEEQLRLELGGAFRRLERGADGYRVVIAADGGELGFHAGSPAEAYGEALLLLLAQRTLGRPDRFGVQPRSG